MKLKLCNIICVMGIILVNASIVFAYDNENTHPNIITPRAVTITTNTLSGYDEYDQYYLRLRQGTIDADVPVGKTLNHFYNPVTGAGGAGIFFNVPSAVVYSTSIWKTAVNSYASDNKEEAYYNMGHVLHLLQDMASSAHVYNDAHVAESNGYEDWVSTAAQYTPSLLLNGTSISQPVADVTGDGTVDYRDYLHEVVKKTSFSV